MNIKFSALLLFSFVVLSILPTAGQTLTATVPTGNAPWAVAVNPVTNKIYTANETSRSVTVIDGATNATATIPAGDGPFGMAINPVTNKIYVVSMYHPSLTIIDGSTNKSKTIQAGGPYAVAVNSITNKIYGAVDGNLLILDGTTDSYTMVSMPSCLGEFAIAVNPVSNKIYATCAVENTVAIIDGVTNSVAFVSVGTNPVAVVVNPVTNLGGGLGKSNTQIRLNRSYFKLSTLNEL